MVGAVWSIDGKLRPKKDKLNKPMPFPFSKKSGKRASEQIPVWLKSQKRITLINLLDFIF